LWYPARKNGWKMESPRLRRILNLLKKYKPQKVILFGSYANGTNDPYSDIDLVIIKNTRRRFLDRIRDVIEIIKPNFAIDILVYTPKEFQEMFSEGNLFVESVIKKGKVVYEKK
jgi:predicted nucleotidyltransferase